MAASGLPNRRTLGDFWLKIGFDTTWLLTWLSDVAMLRPKGCDACGGEALASLGDGVGAVLALAASIFELGEIKNFRGDASLATAVLWQLAVLL